MWFLPLLLILLFPKLVIAEPDTKKITENINNQFFNPPIQKELPEFPRGKQYNTYELAGIQFNVDPAILMAVHESETRSSGNTCINSYAGAVGPMQFLPSTFAAYAIDGDGDGVKNICDLEDAIFTASHYLAANGANRNQVRQALWQYNHANWYVDMVLERAIKYGYKG